MALSPASTRSMTTIAASAERNSMLNSSTRQAPRNCKVLCILRFAAAAPDPHKRNDWSKLAHDATLPRHPYDSPREAS